MYRTTNNKEKIMEDMIYMAQVNNQNDDYWYQYIDGNMIFKKHVNAKHHISMNVLMYIAELRGVNNAHWFNL